jgi:hypothetical protein
MLGPLLAAPTWQTSERAISVRTSYLKGAQSVSWRCRGEETSIECTSEEGKSARTRQQLASWPEHSARGDLMIRLDGADVAIQCEVSCDQQLR